MKKLWQRLDEHFEEYFLIAVTIMLIVIILLQVIMRYVFNNSLSWTEEIARFLFIWQVWIGVSFAAQRNKHIRVDVLRDVMKNPRVKMGLDLFSLSVSMIFTIFLAYQSVFVVSAIADMNQLSPANQIPMWIPYLAVLVGVIFATLRFIQKIIQKIGEIVHYNAPAEEVTE